MATKPGQLEISEAAEPPAETPPPASAAKVRLLTFSGELNNYFVRESHAFFGNQSRAWLETSAQFGVSFHHKILTMEMRGLAVKTTGLDMYGTGTVPTGAPPGTPASGKAPALFLERAFFQLSEIAGLPVKLTVGRQPIVIGSQFIIGDGVYDGFVPSVRQGVYHNPRKGFDAVRLEWDARGIHFDSFAYRVHPSWDGGAGRDGWLGGMDISRSFGKSKSSLAGGLFLRHSPSRLDNDMAVLNLRGEKHFPRVDDLYFGAELVWEFAGRCRNVFYCTVPGQRMNEYSWHAEIGYQANKDHGKPFVEAGYVFYSHDFTPIATGFSDWGKWYLGNQIDWIVFGTNTKIARLQAGFWPRATVKLHAQFHNTREAAPSGAGERGSLSNEFSFISEWYPKEKLWFNLLLGTSRPGPALGPSGLGNPFAFLNSGAAAVGTRSSFDLVLATGIRF